MENNLSLWQQKALAIAPKPGAILSLYFSVYTIVDICRCPDRRKKTYHRLILVMMSLNAISSALYFIGTWALPKESGMYLAFGTKATCTIQGTMITGFSASKLIYYSMLPLFSYLAIRCDFDETKLRRYEPWFHIVALPLPLASAVTYAIKGFIHPNGSWCFLGRNPPGCDNNGNCNHGNMQGYPFFIYHLGLIFFFITLANVMTVAVCVLARRKQNQNMSLIGKKKVVEGFRQNRATAVKRQAALYFGALYLTFGFSLISRIIQTTRQSIHFPTLIIGIITVSFQGCINVFVYDQTRLKKATVTAKEVYSHQSPSTLVTEIRRNIRSSQNSIKEEGLGNRKPKQKQFSIFDGSATTRRPSSIWSEFILDDEDSDSENSSMRDPEKNSAHLRQEDAETSS